MWRKVILAMPLRYMVLVSSLVFALVGHAANLDRPEHIDTITRSETTYESPKNTLAAVRSALLAGELGWADEALTEASVIQSKKVFREGGVDRDRLIEIERQVEATYLVEQVKYKDATLLIVEDHGFDGSVKRYPVTMIQENDLWKITNKYSRDDVIWSYGSFAPSLYDGKGQKPGDVNKFLRYMKPTEAVTTLEAGVSEYTLRVFYGPWVNPTTFEADLNNKDVTDLFRPKASSDEEVTLTMQPGRNVLVLSIRGKKENGKIQRDTDRLVFLAR